MTPCAPPVCQIVTDAVAYHALERARLGHGVKELALGFKELANSRPECLNFFLGGEDHLAVGEK